MRLNFTRITPEPGTSKIIKRFAWLPIFVGNECIWLERYEVLLVWTSITHPAVVKDKAGNDKEIYLEYSQWLPLAKRLPE